MVALKARGLTLNSNWANEAYLWSCPVCKRPKADIFRLNNAGNLQATLEWHHDHLTDFFKDELVRHFGREWKSSVGEEYRHIERASSSLVSRFGPTLVCSDCNEVDGRIKGAISMDPGFSYRPSEIARCIRPVPHHSHELDMQAADRIWEEERADFEDRKSLVALLIDKLRAGQLKKERPSSHAFSRNGMDFHKLMLQIIPQPASAFVFDTLAKLQFRSVSRPIRVEKDERARARRAVVPTDADINAISSGSVPSHKWKVASDLWCCPACVRTKREIVRKSNTKEWFAAIYSHTEWCIRPGSGYGDERIDAYVDHHHTFLVCGDCRAVMRDLRGRTSDNDIYNSFLTADQLRQVVSAMPHAPHFVDWERAAFFAGENAKWTTAIAEYEETARHALSVKQMFDRRMKLKKSSTEAEIIRLAEEARVDYPEEWSPSMLIEHIEYLLERAAAWQESASSSFSELHGS